MDLPLVPLAGKVMFILFTSKLAIKLFLVRFILRPSMRTRRFSWVFFIHICSLFLCFCNFVVSGQCLSEQKVLLLQLKNSLVFDSALSTKLVYWNRSTNCCSWQGVTCNGGHVIALDLTEEAISGGLDNSSGLFRLQYLQNLSLANNHFFNFPFPSGFEKLTNLRYLNLSKAAFAGQIPIAISRLTRLVVLDLSASYFIRGPSLYLENPTFNMLIQNLSGLVELHLDTVRIEARGNDWCQALSSSLPNLRVLSLSDCSISGTIDSSFLKLKTLSIIRLDSNNLNGTFPEKIFEAPTLQVLDLSFNSALQGSFSEFPSNGSLRTLVLRNTNFSGLLPSSIGKLKMLSLIDLSNCNFRGQIPTSMANLTQLLYLDMSYNSFSGSAPSFSRAKNLTQINISNNDLNGHIISTQWEELLKLESLDLSHNSLEGSITSIQWEELLKLEILDLGYNSFRGSIPGYLFSLPSLWQLWLSNNRFSGQLPEFSNVSSYRLQILDLSSNNLEGPIPVSIFELRGLEELSLSSNNFNSFLHLGVIQQLKHLSSLDLSNNNLKVFPDFLRNQTELTMLDLSENDIHGEIPNWIWRLPNLHNLNLSYNSLVTMGEPSSNFSDLSWLDLRSNQLQGQLPFFPPSVMYLDISRNKLNGKITQSICNATDLQVLDLSDNIFSGRIPRCLWRLFLGVLNLRRNNLTGAIPDTFEENMALQTLALNGNQLEGELPKSLANCTGLQVLDLGNNHLEDGFPCYLKNIATLRVLVLRSNRFYGSIGCAGPNATWPRLQVIDLALNNFSGKLTRIPFGHWGALMGGEDEADSEVTFLQYGTGSVYYLDTITVTVKNQERELVKILTIFTSLDFSCNNFDGPIPEELGGLELLYILNFSHNSFTGQIPSSLGKLNQLEALDLSSNKLTGEIPLQLADGLIFLSVLNLSYNQLVGKIPVIKQFATFSDTSYEGNEGLCGFPSRKKCADEDQPGSSPPTSEATHSKPGVEIDRNFLSIELGFIFGLAIIIGTLMFWKRWRMWYSRKVDDLLFKIFPQLYLPKKHRRRQDRRS